MSRADFDPATIDMAFRRQGGRCARCGKFLYHESSRPTGVSWDAHHANGLNSDNRPGQCVLVCVPGCHLKSHAGKTAGPTVLSHDSFRFRNWGDSRPERRRAPSGRARLVPKATSARPDGKGGKKKGR